MKPEEIAARVYRGDGEIYTVNANGEIGRPRHGVNPSPAWRIVGAVERNNFGNVVRFYSLAEILSDPARIPWKFKNGKQRVFIRDFDHGSVREWCAPGARMGK